MSAWNEHLVQECTLFIVNTCKRVLNVVQLQKRDLHYVVPTSARIQYSQQLYAFSLNFGCHCKRARAFNIHCDYARAY